MFLVCILISMFVSFVNTSAHLRVEKSQDAVFNISIPSARVEEKRRKFDISLKNKAVLRLNNASYENMYEKRVNVTDYVPGGWVSFILYSVKGDDAGWYKVTSVNNAAIPGYAGEVLIVTDTPTDPVMALDGTILTSVIYITRGDNVTLTCSSNSTSQPPNHNLTMSYTWRYQNRSESSVVNGSMFTLQSISKEQNGDVISCRAKEQHGLFSNWSKEVSLNVQYEPEVVLLSPYDDDDDDIFGVDKGEDLILNCSADCNPVCDVVWVDSDGVVVVSDGDGHAQLHVTVDLQTFGNYTCQVSNIFGNASREISIRLVVPGSPAVVWVVVPGCVLAVAVIAGVLIFIYKKKTGGERYRVRGEGHIEEAEKDVYARVKKTKKKTVTDEYACVKKLRPAACVNQFYHMSPENQDLLSHDFNDAGLNENLKFNCGETNVDGLIYADLDLPRPSFIDGKPVIFRSEEATVYEEIDFSKTPGPQLPDKIWEQE